MRRPTVNRRAKVDGTYIHNRFTFVCVHLTIGVTLVPLSPHKVARMHSPESAILLYKAGRIEPAKKTSKLEQTMKSKCFVTQAQLSSCYNDVLL